MDYKGAFQREERVSRAESGLRPHVIDFVQKWVKERKFGILFDPFVTSPALLLAAAANPAVTSTTGIVWSQSVRDLAVSLGDSRSTWLLGDPMELLRAGAPTFDAAISAPPLAMRPRVTPPLGTRDVSFEVLALAATGVHDTGAMAFVMNEKLNVGKDAEAVRGALGNLGLSISAIVALPDALVSISIPLQLVFIEPGSFDEVFLARLAIDSDGDQVLTNLLARREGRVGELGQLIDPARYRGWSKRSAELRLEELLRRSGSAARRLADIADIRAVTLRPEVDFDTAPNAVYLTEIRGVPTRSPSSDDARSRRYVEIVLDPEEAQAEFVAQWFDSTAGRVARELAGSGTTIPRVSAAAAAEIMIGLPPLEVQLKAVRTDQRLRAAALQAEELRSQLWSKPAAVKEIARVLPPDSEDGDLSRWMESLPFPLASIAYRYSAAESSDERAEHLLHFFEAAAEFTTTLLLSAVVTDEALFHDERQRLRSPSVDKGFDRSTFGTWTVAGQTLAKTVRRLLAEPKRRSHALTLFAVSDEGFANALTSKQLWSVLDGARSVRNEQHHGGIRGKAHRERQLERLEGLLLQFREVSIGLFAETEVVQAGSMSFRNGLFVQTVRRLTGPNSIFRSRQVESLIPLAEGDLYVIDSEGRVSNALKILGFVRLLASPDNEQNAVYFYSRRETDSTLQFVSYHFEGSPSHPVSDAAFAAFLDQLVARPEVE